MSDDGSTKQVLNRMLVGNWAAQAIYAAAGLRIADLLGDGPRPVAGLAADTGTHADALHRLFRALASVGIFVEDGDGRFQLTPLALHLQSDGPDSQRALAIMMGAEFYQTFGNLLSSVRTGEAVVERTFGKPFFQYLTERPERAEIFDAAMTGVHGPETEHVASARDLSPFQMLTDVGSGNGTQLAAILQRNPTLRGTLFDLPPVVARAQDLFSRSGLSDRCRLLGGDFFSSVPAGADAYILRHVIHDWDDDQAALILNNCRDAMGPEGKVLVVETVIPTGNEPCFGKWLDLMMLVAGGRERTEEQYRRLFSLAGLRLNRVVPTSDEVRILEGERAE